MTKMQNNYGKQGQAQLEAVFKEADEAGDGVGEELHQV